MICIIVVRPIDTKISAYHAFAETNDSNFYASIAKEGYSFSPARPMNATGFFPGYPVLAKLVSLVLPVDTQYALNIAAQATCIGMWMYFLLFLRRWKTPPSLTFTCVLALFSFPSAFYFVKGYSESLFTFSLLGALYWLTDTQRPRWLLASIHGFILSATRLLGLPLSILPATYALIMIRYDRSLWNKLSLWIPALGSSLIFSLGALSFFGFLSSTFGQWNLYFQSQFLGWQHSPSIQLFLDWHIFLMFPPNLDRIAWFIGDLNRLSVPFLFEMLFLLLGLELFIKTKSIPSLFSARVPFYLTAILLFFGSIAACGIQLGNTVFFGGMLRYGLVVYVVLLLIFAHAASSLSLSSALIKRILLALVIIASIGSLGLQLFLNIIFQETINFVA
ncbi:MAG: hypothetical protein Q7S29_05260 [Candidatus Peribacter sp.]|nr:hypothetical protein [Candidatus Peribacter sp.]